MMPLGALWRRLAASCLLRSETHSCRHVYRGIALIILRESGLESLDKGALAGEVDRTRALRVDETIFPIGR